MYHRLLSFHHDFPHKPKLLTSFGRVKAIGCLPPTQSVGSSEVPELSFHLMTGVGVSGALTIFSLIFA